MSSNSKAKKPLGKPLNWSAGDIDQLVVISESDKKAANRLWQAEAPVEYKNLLLASKENKANG